MVISGAGISVVDIESAGLFSAAIPFHLHTKLIIEYTDTFYDVYLAQV